MPQVTNYILGVELKADYNTLKIKLIKQFLQSTLIRLGKYKPNKNQQTPFNNLL